MNIILHPVPLILPVILVALVLLGVREYLQIVEKNRELRDRLKLAEANVHFGHTVAWELTKRKDALEREVSALRKANTKVTHARAEQGQSPER